MPVVGVAAYYTPVCLKCVKVWVLLPQGHGPSWHELGTQMHKSYMLLLVSRMIGVKYD